MKNRLGLIILILICVGLAVTLIWTRKQAGEQKSADVATIGSFSNKLATATDDLASQRQVNVEFNKLLNEQKEDLENLTKAYVQLSTNLETTSNSLEEVKAQVAQREAKIAELESQNQALDQRAVDLSASITNLTSQIEETKRKLAASEGDKAMLTRELNQLMAQKAELERQFNDLKVLRAQVAKLKSEMTVSQRIRWIREGLFARSEQKGAELLMQHSPPPTNRIARSPNYDLNVEIGSDGSIKVIPPLTNSPAGNSPPAR